MLTHNELVLRFGGSYVCANLGEKAMGQITRVSAVLKVLRSGLRSESFKLQSGIKHALGEFVENTVTCGTKFRN